MKKFSIIAAAALVPSVAAAQQITDIRSIFTFVKNMLDLILPLIIALAVVYFVWGLFQLLTAADDDKKTKAKSTIIYGIISLFVMVSIWGLVNILTNTFGLQNTSINNGNTNPINTIPNIPR